jgi:dTDP-L-rhamnose 4-epimerase
LVKILVTGGAGFIGSHTTDALLKKGYRVRVLDNLEPPVHRNREKPAYLSPEIEFLLGDVRNRADMEKALIGVEAVFHLAAYQGYLTDFSKFAAVNDAGTALLYELIVGGRFPVRKIVLASSQAIYGEGKHQCPSHGIQYPLPRLKEQLQKGDWEVKCPVCGQSMKSLTTDEARVNPHNQYSASKYSQELYALALGRRFGVPTVALRYSITQGPRQSFSNAYSGILRIFTVRLLTNQPLVMYEDGEQLRDYVHVHDVVSANILALESDAANYEAYNVGGTRAVSVREFTGLLTRSMDKKVQPECSVEFRFGDVRHIVSDVSKLRQLGWEPAKTLRQNISDYVDWVRTQPAVLDYYAEAEKVMRQQGVIQRVR